MTTIARLMNSMALAGALLAASSLGSEPDQPPAEASRPAVGLRVGDTAPNAQVAKPNGDPVELKELYELGPIILVFYRGGWCPYCNKALRAWEENLVRISLLGGTIIALTPEGPTHTENTRRDQNLRFAVLSDYKQDAAKQFGLSFEMPDDLREKYLGYGVDLSKRNWDQSWMLPHPATYVIDRDGIIRYAYADTDYSKRADPAEVIRVLEEMKRERDEAGKR